MDKDKNDYLMLLRKIAQIGDAPFQSEVIRSPWEPLIDVKQHNQLAKNNILDMLCDSKKVDKPHSLVIVAAPGKGKTHLLTWTRLQLENDQDIAFVYISPYRSQYGSIAQHIFNSVLISLFKSSASQQAEIEKRIRKSVVSTYDKMVKGKEGRRVLKIKWTLLSRLLGNSPQIGNKDERIQRKKLASAVDCPEFLAQAFNSLSEDPPFLQSETQLEYDTFRAICYYLFSSINKKNLAWRWLQGEVLDKNEQKLLDLRQSSWQANNLKDSIWTLACMTNNILCLGFDQMEDTYLSFNLTGDIKYNLDMLVACLEELYPLPILRFIFLWQRDSWQKISSMIPYHLVKRMTEGYGFQRLEKFSFENAKEFVRLRMKKHVWQRLGETPPHNNPYFPLDDNDILLALEKADKSVDGFIKNIRATYKKKLIDAYPPSPKGPKISEITPNRSYTTGRKVITIRAENITDKTRVFFGEQQAQSIEYDLEKGEIRAEAPQAEAGKVKLRLVSIDGNEDSAEFEYRNYPSFLRDYISTKKLQAKRNNLGITQATLAKRLGYVPAHICNAEKGKFASDSLYEKLADFYKCPIEDFIRDEKLAKEEE